MSEYYHYQRRLRPAELAQAAGIGLGIGAAVGLVGFYFIRIFMQRERVEANPPAVHRSVRGARVLP